MKKLGLSAALLSVIGFSAAAQVNALFGKFEVKLSEKPVYEYDNNIDEMYNENYYRLTTDSLFFYELGFAEGAPRKLNFYRVGLNQILKDQIEVIEYGGTGASATSLGVVLKFNSDAVYLQFIPEMDYDPLTWNDSKFQFLFQNRKDVDDFLKKLRK